MKISRVIYEYFDVNELLKHKTEMEYEGNCIFYKSWYGNDDYGKFTLFAEYRYL